jgi:hypothetical protein
VPLTAPLRGPRTLAPVGKRPGASNPWKGKKC